MPQTPESVIALQARLAVDKDLANFVRGRFVLKLTGQHSGEWVISSGVNQGEDSKCVFELSSADFEAMVAGSLNPQAAYLAGKIRIAGDDELALRFIRLCRSH